MSVNTNSQGAAVASAKHRGRNAEGSVRVLGQTAAVAGISGALLLALKAMVLVSPAVLPDTDGLDALGRPNSIIDVTDGAPAPVIFAPASNPIATTPTFGQSERTGVFSPTRPSTVGKVADETDKQAPGPKTPVGPSTPAKPPAEVPGTVGKVTKPVTDVLDGAVPGVGKTVKGVTDTLDKTTKPVVDTAKALPVVGPVVGQVEETAVGEKGLVPTVTGTLGNVVGGSSNNSTAPKKKVLGLL